MNYLIIFLFIYSLAALFIAAYYHSQMVEKEMANKLLKDELERVSNKIEQSDFVLDADVVG